MGLFGGAFARAKNFSLTQVKFQFNNEQKFKYCMKLKRIKMLKQKGYKQCQKAGTQKQKLFGTFFDLFVSVFSKIQLQFSSVRSCVSEKS